MRDSVVQDIEKQVKERPDHPALIEASGRQLSYQDLWRNIQQGQEQFASTGVRSGDLCGFMASDGAEYVTNALSIMEAGGCFVPIPESHRDKPKSMYFQQLDLDWLVDEQDGFQAREISGAQDQTVNDDFNQLDLNPAFVRFTSGTTGQRKGVLLGHETIRERTDAANRALNITPDDRILWMLSMDHHFVVSILTYLKNGATILLPEHMLGGPVSSFASEQRATVIYATPYHFRMLNGAEGKHSMDDLRLAISTAEGISRDTARRFYDTFHQPIGQALGIIEVGLPAVNTDQPLEKPDSVGRVLPDYNVTLVNDEEQPIPGGADETGELHVDGPGLFDAYLCPWKPREQVLTAYGFATGDQARLDEEGLLYIEGRRTNRINRAGNKFFCEEVEDVLNRHPDVKESRVYGKPHPKLGELPYADVVPEHPNEGPDASELAKHCADHLAEYKVPRSFELKSELPRTPTGKIKRTRSADELT